MSPFEPDWPPTGKAHTTTLRGVPGSRELVVVCACGWESEPVHLINVELMRSQHRAEVSGDA